MDIFYARAYTHGCKMSNMKSSYCYCCCYYWWWWRGDSGGV